MAQEPLQSTFDVVVNDDTYTFQIPTIRFDIEVGYKAADVRARAYPEGGGTLGGLDFAAANFSRYCAYIELYLRRATTLWPYGYDNDDLGNVDFSRPPQVDFLKFPADRTEDVYQVGAAFDTEVGRFRQRRDRSRERAGAEVVDGSGNPGPPQPIRQAAA